MLAGSGAGPTTFPCDSTVVRAGDGPRRAHHQSLTEDAMAPVFILSGTIALLGFVLAMVEIQTTGIHGWAASLPTTWRVESHAVLDWCLAGRPLTAWHAWLLGFLFIMVHLPVALLGAWNLKLEARALGTFVLLWLARDVWWFVLNPNGLAMLTPERATWIKHWFLKLPADWWLHGAVGGLLLWWSFRLYVKTTTKPVETEESLSPSR
jgi:hypothetical protein